MTTTIASTPTRCDEYFPQRSRLKPPLNEVPIPKELKRDYGFATLPKKFNILVTLFNEMEKILQNAYGREQRKTFAELTANVEKNCKKKFTEKHLAQIAAVYPKAYIFRWEKAKGRAGFWDLVIQPDLHLNRDLAPFIDSYLASLPPKEIAIKKTGEGEEEDANSANWAIPPPANGLSSSPLKRAAADLPLSPVKLISPLKSPRRNNSDYIFRSPQKPKQATIFCQPLLDGRPKMDANRLKWRKMIFRHLLVNRVREAHEKFLSEKKITFDDSQSVHEHFKEAIEELVPDIQTDGAIPLRRKLNNQSPSRNLQTTDIRQFLESVKCKTPSDREKTPERRPPPIVCKSEPKTPKMAPKGVAKFEPITPKTPLEERLKAKFAINEAARKGGLPDMQRRRALLHRLECSILDVLGSHLNLEQRFSVGLTDRVLLQKMGKEITDASLLDHLRLLCDLMSAKSPKICWLESLGDAKTTGPGAHFFQISREVGPKWVTAALETVKAELATVESKMRTLHRSPSSCF